MTSLAIIPVALGFGAGLLINRWWAVLVAVMVGLLARLVLGDQGDFPDWGLPFVAAWLTACGVALGLLLRFVEGEVRRRRNRSLTR